MRTLRSAGAPRQAHPAQSGSTVASVPARWERAVLGMLWAGLTADQISRLADLRVRLRRRACTGDGETWPPGTPAARRLEFARWLVQTGRLRDG